MMATIATYKEEVLFNIDTLSKVISYLPSVDLVNLALTCKRFGVSNNNDAKVSLIEESARILVKEIATDDQLAALPCYDGETSLADYHYLQLMRSPLTFDQLVGDIEYANASSSVGPRCMNNVDKSCVRYSGHGLSRTSWSTAFSNNVLRAGKHYVMFEVSSSSHPFVKLGVMRPVKASQNASGAPDERSFFQHFSRRIGHGEHNNKVHCCMYYSITGKCICTDWSETLATYKTLEGLEYLMSSGDILGLLLDLDEGTLSLYKNGRKLGVMKRGLAGPYCWVVSICKGVQVTIKRGTIPPS